MSDPEQGPPFQPGARIGRYVITRVLGEGGMGVVYEGMHAELHKRVAIKTLHNGRGPYSDVVLERFVREGQAAARIQHPNVVDVVDVGVWEGQPFLVMEFLEGEDLARFIASRAPLAPEPLVDLLIPIVSALCAAHRAQIVHRDLKPENIFLTRDAGGRIVPKLVDFGISKLRESTALTLTATHAVLGTPYYMSPEQARSARDVDHRSDIFSLGVILYQCTTHALPFKGDSLFELLEAIVHSEPDPVRALVGHVPTALEATIDRALQKDRNARFQTMAELGAALLPLASERTRLNYAEEFAHAQTLFDPDGYHGGRPSEDAGSGDPGTLSPITPARTDGTRGRGLWLVLAASAVSALSVLGVFALIARDGAPPETPPLAPDPQTAAAAQVEPAPATAAMPPVEVTPTAAVAPVLAAAEPDAGVAEQIAQPRETAPPPRKKKPRPETDRQARRRARVVAARPTESLDARPEKPARSIVSAKRLDPEPAPSQSAAPKLQPITPPEKPLPEEDLFGDRK